MRWFQLGVVDSDQLHLANTSSLQSVQGSDRWRALPATVAKFFPDQFGAIADIVQGDHKSVEFRYHHDYLTDRVAFAVGFRDDKHAVVYALKLPD